MDFYIWVLVKNKVYEKNPKTMNELNDYIHGTHIYLQLGHPVYAESFFGAHAKTSFESSFGNVVKHK